MQHYLLGMLICTSFYCGCLMFFCHSAPCHEAALANFSLLPEVFFQHPCLLVLDLWINSSFRAVILF